MIDKNTIKKVIDSLSFVILKGEISEDNAIINFHVETLTEEGGGTLDWRVCIEPSYPYKVGGRETIHFFNTSLLEYPHIMRSGFLCLHTPNMDNPEQQLTVDLARLKEWIDKYYVRKEKDEHYEELVVGRREIDGIYYNFYYTETDKAFPKNDYGTVDLVSLMPGIHDGKRIKTYIANVFQSNNTKEQYCCQWKENYQGNTLFEGIYCFLDKAPSLYDKFVLEQYSNMSTLFSWSQMAFLAKRAKEKSIAPRIPLFCGYYIPNGEVRWQVAMLKTGAFPIKSEKVRCGGRPFMNYSFKKELIDWAYPYNCSYIRFFGRGAMPFSLAEKKIFIIGIGAIGSIVATTLTRCGAKFLDYYDIDLKEPGNICRSDYDFLSGVSDKSHELYSILHSISPFVHCEIPNSFLDFGIKKSGDDDIIRDTIMKVLNRYDIIFDCSTDDGLMNALENLNLKPKIINLSISNHAKELVCAFCGNIANTIKFMYNSIINSDQIDMFYPTGCWSPTFKASYNDVASKVQLALKYIIKMLTHEEPESNFYISENKDGLQINRV